MVPTRILHPVPDNLTLEKAALTEPCSVAYHATAINSQIHPGDRVVVLGPGPIGILCADIARLCGAVVAVTGQLSWSGNFGWKGLIFVVGDGKLSFAGGGNGEIDGTVFVSKIWDSTCTGSPIPGHGNLCTSVEGPSFHWNGGGGNGIRFDHCWATDLMNQIPMGPFSSGKLGKMVSFRILPY